ncbi:hypothetical protein ACKKBG_A26990 [Auxenochlorella protothecoides x Auxenochlorella symbiontica]
MASSVSRPPVTVEKVDNFQPPAASKTNGDVHGNPSSTAGNAGSSGPDSTQDPNKWLADLIAHLWPYASNAIEALANDMIPDILAASRPSFVHDLKLKKFELGKARPKLTNLRVTGDTRMTGDVNIEFDFDWKSEGQALELYISVPKLPLLVSEVVPDPLEDTLALLMSLTVMCTDLWLKGTARVTLRPLLEEMPVVGGVRISLINPPDFGYDLKLGFVLETMEPLIKSWVDGVVKESVLQPYVLPEHLWIPITDDAEDVDKPEGVLHVKILNATGVPRMDLLGGCDPYLEIYVRDSQRRLTDVRKKTREPTWNESFVFAIAAPQYQELRMIMWDEDEWSPPDEIGRALLPIKELEHGKQTSKTLDFKARVEEVHEEEKAKATRMQHFAMALGRPFIKKGGTMCHLNVEVTYTPLSRKEVELVENAMRHGAEHALRQRSVQQGISPAVRELIRTGVVQLTLHNVHSKTLVSKLRTPHVKASMRVKESEKSSPLTLANRRGQAAFPAPLSVHVGLDAVEDESTMVEIIIQEKGWVGTSTVGKLEFPLATVIKRMKTKGEFHLQEGSGTAKLDLRWTRYL